MAGSADVSPVLSQSSLEEKEKNSLKNGEVKRISTKEVYDLGKEIAQEMQRITADYGKSCLEGLVERVVRTLEWLEVCAIQNEELQKTKFQLLLKQDEHAREKERTKKLQKDLKVCRIFKKKEIVFISIVVLISQKGMTLVVEERGRQRDLFAGRLSELEIQNKNYQEMINAYEQAQTRKQRSKRYSTISKYSTVTVLSLLLQ